MISPTSVKLPPPLLLRSRTIPSIFCAFNLMISFFMSSEAFLPFGSSKSALKLGKLIKPYFLPSAELTMMLRAKVSSMETSSRVMVTSLMLLSSFSTVNTTLVPSLPRINRTASSTNIPTTFTASSLGLDLTFRILSPLANCFDFQAGAPIDSSPK